MRERARTGNHHARGTATNLAACRGEHAPLYLQLKSVGIAPPGENVVRSRSRFAPSPKTGPNGERRGSEAEREVRGDYGGILMAGADGSGRLGEVAEGIESP